MSDPSDYFNEMQRLPLDLDTADRLLGGSIPPADAPPGYSGVAALVGGLDLEHEAVTPDEQWVSVLASAVRSSQVETGTSPRRTILPRIKFTAAIAFAALVGTTGLAFAGSLPGAAQDIASTMLAKAGVTVPGPNENAGDHPNTRGTSSESNVTVTPSSAGKGSEISDLATSDLTGLEKGAAVSTAASNGKSRAGEEHAAPVETPNPGGTETADTASGGASSAGTTEADEASGGHSSAGSGNAAGGQSHRP
jgi:hypothetical protein